MVEHSSFKELCFLAWRILALNYLFYLIFPFSLSIIILTKIKYSESFIEYMRPQILSSFNETLSNFFKLSQFTQILFYIHSLINLNMAIIANCAFQISKSGMLKIISIIFVLQLGKEFSNQIWNQVVRIYLTNGSFFAISIFALSLVSFQSL